MRPRGAAGREAVRDAYGIGVDADQGYLGSYIPTSALKKVDVAVVQATRDLIHGKFFDGGEHRQLGVHRGAGYGKLNAVAAKPYAGQLQKILDEIKSGKITNIPTTVK